MLTPFHRQQIGPLIFKEEDELIRCLVARLVTDLRESGTPIESLFPADYDRQFYDRLPPPTQNRQTWIITFEAYIDEVYSDLNIAG